MVRAIYSITENDDISYLKFKHQQLNNKTYVKLGNYADVHQILIWSCKDKEFLQACSDKSQIIKRKYMTISF